MRVKDRFVTEKLRGEAIVVTTEDVIRAVTRHIGLSGRAQPVRRGREDRKARPDPQGQTVRTERQAQPAPRGRPDPRVVTAETVQQVQQGLQAQRVQQGLQAQRVRRGRTVR